MECRVKSEESEKEHDKLRWAISDFHMKVS